MSAPRHRAFGQAASLGYLPLVVDLEQHRPGQQSVRRIAARLERTPSTIIREISVMAIGHGTEPCGR